MAYIVPTPGDIKARFPEFATVSGDTIALFIEEAQLSVDNSWIETHYKPALQYLTAHLMKSEGLPGATGSLLPVGSLVSEKLGDAQKDYSEPPQGGGLQGLDTFYGTTSYGREFVRLRNLSHPAVLYT